MTKQELLTKKVEDWKERFGKLLRKIDEYYGNDEPNFLNNQITILSTSLSEAYDAGGVAILEEVMEYVEHTSECVRSRFSSGEPTEDGGYRQNFAGKWYQARPIDETPKCDCGLDDLPLLSSLSRLKGTDQT